MQGAEGALKVLLRQTTLVFPGEVLGWQDSVAMLLEWGEVLPLALLPAPPPRAAVLGLPLSRHNHSAAVLTSCGVINLPSGLIAARTPVASSRDLPVLEMMLSMLRSVISVSR